MQSKQIGKHLNRKYSKRHKLFHGFILSKVIETQHPNSTISVHTSEYLIFFRIWLHFHHQALVMELQSFKKVNYVHSINQMRLFWLLNVECFSIIFLKYISFHFTFSNQNKRIWLIEWHILYILEKVQLCNQSLVIKMALNLNQMRKKTSSVRRCWLVIVTLSK